jgi:hypothetical protein
VSLTLDFSGLWSQAGEFVKNLWPVFVIPLGMILGIGILGFIVKSVKSALGHI